MTCTQPATRRGDAFGMLVWTLPVRLLDVSRGGCRVEVARHIETGTSGQLEIGQEASCTSMTSGCAGA